MKIVKLLLVPFAMMYNLATKVRNHLYDIGHKPSFEFDTFVLAVGNLNVGGSGKTPMVEYIIRLLKDRYPLATLSRGYKRRTKGYRIAAQGDTAAQLGDEPMQLQRKFGSEIHVAVGEDRVYAIPHILQEFPETRVIVLDDALQHRSVRPQLTVLVTDYARPFYSDFLLPLGRLREARRGASRVDMIVVTKCPATLSEEEQERMAASIHRYAPGKPVFFTAIQHDEPRAFSREQPISKNIVLVSGIARTESLTQFCFSNFTVLHHFRYPDHHRYTQEDLAAIEKYCRQLEQPYSILTTEKDMVKLVQGEFASSMERLPWFFLPIRQVFVKDGLIFDEHILSAVQAKAGK